MIGSDVIAISLPRSSSRGGTAPADDPQAAWRARKASEFIVGPENRLARFAVQWWFDATQQTYSPLVLYGPSGSGKSLLAHGLAESRENGLLTTGADFVREVATAIDDNALTEFRTHYRSANLVVMDDLTDLAGRRSAQRELINLLDALELREVPVALTSRVPLDEITELPPGLRTRLASGLLINLAPPGNAARAEILRRLVAECEIELEPTAVVLLAEGVVGTVPVMQGALRELTATLDGGSVVRMADVRRFLTLRRVRQQPNIGTIIKVVAQFYGLKPTKLTGSARSRQVSLARSMAIYLGRQLTGQSLESLGKYFGNRDHSTVLYLYRTLEGRLEIDAELRAAANVLRESLATKS
ncbi:MAG: ATP-binding protein [Pirellulales bacterium]|nr:ATP-binding protein [Pirellulales bacterium]